MLGATPHPGSPLCALGPTQFAKRRSKCATRTTPGTLNDIQRVIWVHGAGRPGSIHERILEVLLDLLYALPYRVRRSGVPELARVHTQAGVVLRHYCSSTY